MFNNLLLSERDLDNNQTTWLQDTFLLQKNKPTSPKKSGATETGIVNVCGFDKCNTCKFRLNLPAKDGLV